MPDRETEGRTENGVQVEGEWVLEGRELYKEKGVREREGTGAGTGTVKQFSCAHLEYLFHMY